MEKKYQQVKIDVDPYLWLKMRRFALDHGTTVRSIMTEAALAYMKWLRHAELLDGKTVLEEAKKIDIAHEIIELSLLIKEIRRDRARLKRERTQQRPLKLPRKYRKYSGMLTELERKNREIKAAKAAKN